MGIFAGVPFMGIQGFIPGPELIVHALTPREKIPQLRMDIHSTALSGDFFTNLAAGQNPESMNCMIPCLVREICNSGTQIPAVHCYGLPALKHRKFLLVSGFATDFATPGRMYIPAFSIWTYSGMGKMYHIMIFF